MKEHSLKIAPEYFRAVENGTKTFEIRLDDRGFEVGDVVVLREYIKETNEFTGRKILKKIGYITSFEQKNGYVVFSLK